MDGKIPQLLHDPEYVKAQISKLRLKEANYRFLQPFSRGMLIFFESPKGPVLALLSITSLRVVLSSETPLTLYQAATTPAQPHATAGHVI